MSVNFEHALDRRLGDFEKIMDFRLSSIPDEDKALVLAQVAKSNPDITKTATA